MVIARPVTGKYRTIKNRINVFLFAIFLVLPFIRIGGTPLILLDIPARKFFIFGLTIWPQELYFLHILLLFSGFGLFFVTAMWGRIWCGYACPQTVFTEAYDKVARLLVGSNFGKASMKKSRWIPVYIAWSLLSVAFSFVFLFYFARYEDILADIMHGRVFEPGTVLPAAWVVFMVISVGTAIGNMVYFRENMCNLVCPYGRFQTALLDKHSPIVNYIVPRGEPRREKATQKIGEHKGDCIDDLMCVVVCPTGIDIREGLQIGCLSCGLCVDACTTVMGKQKKESLIESVTIEQVDHPEAKVHYARGRTIVYGIILTILASVFTYLLVTRVPIYASAIKEKSISSIYVPGTGWQNGYEIHVGNLSSKDIDVTIEAYGDYPFSIIREDDRLHVGAGGYEKVRFLVQFPETAGRPVASTIPLQFRVTDKGDPSHQKVIKTTFTFPFK